MVFRGKSTISKSLLIFKNAFQMNHLICLIKTLYFSVQMTIFEMMLFWPKKGKIIWTPEFCFHHLITDFASRFKYSFVDLIFGIFKRNGYFSSSRHIFSWIKLSWLFSKSYFIWPRNLLNDVWNMLNEPPNKTAMIRK